MVIAPHSLKRVKNPTGEDNSKDYIFYVKIDDLPKNFPMETNPRDQNLHSNVAIAIRESLESNDGNFHKKNRGLLLSAAGLNYNKTNHEVTIYFDNLVQHGDIDGGHTYKIIQKHQGQHLDQYVRIEVMTGVEDIIEQLAEARNNSIQVDDTSMAELQNKFDPIKEGIKDMQFYKRIAFKQNQVLLDKNGKRLKMINAREVVSLIMMFDPNLYDDSVQPTQAYSSKAYMLKKYLKNVDHYKKFTDVMPDIFRLYDAVETDFPKSYNMSGGKYGRKKYSGYNNNNYVYNAKFSYKEMMYRVPDGLVYPITAAFRSLIQYNNESSKYEWIIDPFKIWDNLKFDLVKSIMDYSNSIGDNPNTTGKDPNIWNLAYMKVKMEKMMEISSN